MGKKKPPQVKISGPGAHNQAFLTAIGQLVIAWANNESVFLGMLQVLLNESRSSAVIIWYSRTNTKSRLDLVWALVRRKIKNEDLVAEIEGAIQHFRTLSGTRNFYCHATYNYDDKFHLVSVSSGTMVRDGDPIRFVDKKMDRAALNELNNTFDCLNGLNVRLWGLVHQMKDELGVQMPELPSPYGA